MLFADTVQVEVHRLVWFVGILAFTIAMILFVIGLARKMDPLNAFVNGFILVVVANVPEVRVSLCCWVSLGVSAVGIASSAATAVKSALDDGSHELCAPAGWPRHVFVFAQPLPKFC